LWAAAKRTIEAAKRITARISNIALWPLAILIATVTKANRRTIRWAIRHRNGTVFLVAILWFPTLTIVGLVWAIASIHEKPNDLWPLLGVILVGVKKALALIAYGLEQATLIRKALRLYC
jgi:apolipoprotein N-acyltransferase